jgi:DegV family protein with EDD domain
MRTFFIDTDSELHFNLVKEFGLELIKMPYVLDGVEYLDDAGESGDYKSFFDALRQGKTSTTSALNTQNYLDIFEPHFKNGEEMFYLTFSHEMSATFSFMDEAIKELSAKYPEASFRSFDSKSISLGCGAQCYYAGKMFKEGKSFDEIIAFLEEFSPATATYFAVDDLDYLKKGGRLSGAAAFAGKLLGIKPILQITDEGKIIKYNTVKGSKKVIGFFIDLMKESATELDKYDVFVLHGDCLERGEELKAAVLQQFPETRVQMQMVGPVIGTHCGPGTLGIIFHAKHR